MKRNFAMALLSILSLIPFLIRLYNLGTPIIIVTALFLRVAIISSEAIEGERTTVPPTLKGATNVPTKGKI